MSNQVVPISRSTQPMITFADMERLAEGIAKSGLFGMKTKDQALALMAISQAEGRHPALAARDYDIIQNRPAKKAEAMMRDFLESGGKVEWHKLDDMNADATFSHPAGGSVRITWDMERVKAAGLNGKDMYKKYPRQMLRSRVVSEGVRTVCPAATSGMYVPEEVADFEPRQAVIVMPPKTAAPLPVPPPIATPHNPDTGEIGPHPIAVMEENGKFNWVDWGAKLIAGFKSAATPRELAEWRDANKTSLENCSASAPKAHKSVMGAYEKCMALLSNAPVASSRKPTTDADLEIPASLKRELPKKEANPSGLPGDWQDYLDRQIDEYKGSIEPLTQQGVIDAVTDAITGAQERGELSASDSERVAEAWNGMIGL